MNTAFRILLLLSLLGYAVAVRLLYTLDERALWLLLVPCIVLPDMLIHRWRGAKGPSLLVRGLLRVFFRFRFILRKYFRVHVAHRRRGRQPSGFCPYCSYPMDPGRCPECGVRVTPENLALQPKPSQAGTIRLVIVLLLIAGAIGGGYYSYHHTSWVEHVSISNLLWLYDWGEPRAMAEIVHRVDDGNLTEKEEQAICNRTLKIKLVNRGPYTRDGMIGVGLVAESELPVLYSRMWIYLRDVEFIVDGKTQNKTLDHAVLIVGNDHLKLSAENAGAGSHVVQVRGHMAVAPAMMMGDPGPSALMNGPFDVSATVDVEDRDSASVFEALTGDEVKQDIQHNIMLQYVRATQRDRNGNVYTVPTLVVSNRSLRGFPIAGRVMVRRAGKGEFQEAKKIICNAGETDRIPLDQIGDIGRARSIDVRIEPDPRQMPVFRREGQMKYIGEVIEQENLRRESNFFGF